eukprot:g22143.t1
MASSAGSHKFSPVHAAGFFLFHNSFTKSAAFSLRQSTNFTAWSFPQDPVIEVHVGENRMQKTTRSREAPSLPKQTTTKSLTFSINFFWRLIAIHCSRDTMLAKKVTLLRQKVHSHQSRTVSMMQEFATFLFKYLQNDDDPLSFYRPGTALQFLSAAECGLEKLFQNYCFVRHDPENVEDKSGDKYGWYYDLRRVLNFKFMTRCFNLGLLAKEKSPGLTRSDNMNISRWLLLHARNAHVAEDAKTRNKYIRWRAYLNNLTQRPLRKVASDAKKWEQAREREREKKPSPSRKILPMTNSLTSVSPWLRTSEKLKPRNAEQERKFKNFITQFDYRKFSGTNLPPANMLL